MSPKSPLLERTVRNLGSLLLVFALFTTTVFAFSFWDSGEAPEAAPGDGNVKLSTSSSSSGGVADETKGCPAGKAIRSFDLSNTSAPACVSVGGSSSGSSGSSSSSGGLTAINVDSCSPGESIREIDFNITGSTANGSVVCEIDDVGSSSGSSSSGSSSGGGDCLWTQNGTYIYNTSGDLTAKVGQNLAKIDGSDMHGYRAEHGSGAVMLGVTDLGLAGVSFKYGSDAFNIFQGNTGDAYLRLYNSGNDFIFDNMRGGKEDGKVGVGTNNPIYKLDVVGSARASDNMGAQAFYDTNNLDYYLDPNGTSVPNNIKAKGTICDKNGCIGGGGGTSLWSEKGSNIYYNGGNVGIGMTSPEFKLHVAGDIATQKGKSMGASAYYDVDDFSFKVDPTGTSKVNSITATGTVCDKNGCIGGGGGGGTPCDWNGWALRQMISRSAEFYGKMVAVGELCGSADTCYDGTKVNFYCQGGVITNSGIVNYCRSCEGI